MTKSPSFFEFVKTNKGSNYNLQLTIKIIDKGVGMNKDELEKLFQNFKTNNDAEFNPNGTGLGLSICKNLI